MHGHRLATLGFTAMLAGPLLAQEATESPAPTTQPAVAPGTWWEQWTQGPKLTGNWGGVRDDLAAKGISFDLDVTQIMQENTHGGAATNNGLKYSGSGDLTLTVDTEKMGLWPGGLFLLHGEPKWGNGVNSKVGSMMPVNTDALKPIGDRSCVMALSEYIYFQSLFDHKLTLIAGKLDASRAFDRNEFANDERTQFMNLGLRNNPVIPALGPYTNLGVGFVLDPVPWMSFVTAFVDSHGAATNSGFNTAFHGLRGSTLAQELDFKIKPFGLPGTQRIGYLFSTRQFKDLEPDEPFQSSGPFVIKTMGLGVASKIVNKIAPFDYSSDNAILYYNFDQYLYKMKNDPTQGFGIFGRFGYARPDVNAIHRFYSLGVGGKGMIPGRAKDTYGVGYYYVDTSARLPYLFHKETGVEVYYNIEITPWMHITPDIQVITDPGGTTQSDCSFVYGFRMQMNL